MNKFALAAIGVMLLSSSANAMCFSEIDCLQRLDRRVRDLEEQALQQHLQDLFSNPPSSSEAPVDHEAARQYGQRYLDFMSALNRHVEEARKAREHDKSE